MPLIYACIAPHAGDLIPDSHNNLKKVARTRTALQTMGSHLQTLKPETIVLISPHGFRVQSALSIAIAERGTAEWSPGLKLDFRMDADLANAIADEADGNGVPVVRYIYGASSGPDCFIPLDWGAVIPLYFLGHQYEPKPGLVQLSPMKSLPYRTHYDFGRAIGRVLKQTTARTALIASADQGHAHQANGPYGFDPAAAQYDSWMQDLIRAGDLDGLLAVDPDLVEHAKPDSLWPTLMLAGALKENPMKGKLLSYEVNVYFGILCAEFRPIT